MKICEYCSAKLSKKDDLSAHILDLHDTVINKHYDFKRIVF